MNKTMVYLIMILFLISVVPAEPTLTNTRERVKTTTKNIIVVKESVAAKNIVTETSKECVERLLKNNPDAEEEALKNRCELKTQTTNRLKVATARKITTKNLVRAKEVYQNAKQKYQIAKQNYMTAQNKFQETKDKIGACRTEETEGCIQAREQIRERAKESLLNTADRILEQINKVKSQVDENEELSEEEAAVILENVDEMIQEIENAKSVIESSEEKEEVIEASKTIKQAWLRVKKRLTIHIGMIVNARVGGVIVKVNQINTKLETTIAHMEEKGLDTSEVQSLVDEFSDNVGGAQTNYELALGKFKDAVSEADVEIAHGLAREGNTYMKKAHKSLQVAQQLLRQITASIKHAGGQDELTLVAEREDGAVDDDNRAVEETEEDIDDKINKEDEEETDDGEIDDDEGGDSE